MLSYATGLAGSGDFQKALETVVKYIDQVKPAGNQLELALSRKKSYEFALQNEKESQTEKKQYRLCAKKFGAGCEFKAIGVFALTDH